MNFAFSIISYFHLLLIAYNFTVAFDLLRIFAYFSHLIVFRIFDFFAFSFIRICGFFAFVVFSNFIFFAFSFF